MKRLVYAFDTAESVQAHVFRLRTHGVENERMSLVARSDIAIDKIPVRLADSSMDVVPAIGRGAVFGGSTGLIAGLIAMAIPPLGIPLSGALLIAFVALGALIGMWSAGIVGASIPNKVERRYEKEISEGHILLVVDASESEAEKVKRWMAVLEPHQIWQGEVDQISK